MKRGIEARLLDAIEAVNQIERYVAGLTWADFEVREDVQLIVERLVITVGEAVAKAEELDEGLVTTLPNIRRIIGARNHIVHGYWNIDPEVLWEIATDKGPELRETLRRLVHDDE